MKRSLASVVVVMVILLVASPASATVVTGPVLVSGPSPFADCTVGGLSDSVNYVNAEVEPFVAVDPTNPQHIVGVYQQDRWTDGGAHGLVAASSTDGGQSWTTSYAALDACSGNPDYNRASDPWVTFDAAGDVYQSSISVTFTETSTTSAVLVSKSTDGGQSWITPSTLITDSVAFDDKESISGDPTRPGYVYATWDRISHPGKPHNDNYFHSFAFRVGAPMFSRTTDGGQTWSVPTLMTNANISTIGNQIAVLPSGRLVDIFNATKGSGIQPSQNQFFIGVMTSDDAGAHWSPPIHIANFQDVVVSDPETGDLIRTGEGLADIAVDPATGELFAVWDTSTFSGGTVDDIALSTSTDGGKTWSAPAEVNQTPSGVAAFTPSVEVGSDGSVAVTYYDFRNDTSDPNTLWTDDWVVVSPDGGATWNESHLAGPFDMRSAPNLNPAGNPDVFFIGDYQGLASMGSGFVALFAQANTGDTANPTDIFASTID